MKRLLLIVLVFLLIPLHGENDPASPAIDPATKPRVFILKYLTIYNPTVRQCDSSPLITASNRRINVKKLRQQQIRWMALSRNLLKRWKGEFRYGDSVRVDAGDPAIDGLWVIHDSMNRRFRDRGDLLFHTSTRRGGLWKNVKLTRWQSTPAAGLD
jgi:hypothetical protein